ncbi:MAG: type IV pilus assembly protein PilM [bacterium]|nr:type IV pilus assembly protein PilM [bacterium]
MAFFGLFGNKSSSVLGVDIGSSSLKVVQLKKQGGKAVLETYGELALGPYAGLEIGQATNLTADKITETLKDLLREAKVTTNNCGVSIPFARSLLTLVELPRRQNKEEQKTIIELEARKYIPVPMNEVQFDWFAVPDEDRAGASADASAAAKVRVLLVAVHNDELTLLQNVMRDASLTASFYEIEIFSTIRAVVDEPVKPVMVLDIGAATTKAYIVEHGVVALSHTITSGGQDATRAIAVAGNMSIAAAETLKKSMGLSDSKNVAVNIRPSIELIYSRIFSEARRVLSQYETTHQKAIAAIILTGGGGVTKGLGPYAQSAFSIEVRVADPFSKTEAPAFIRPVLQEIGPEFAVAVGLALRKLEEI